jgi:chloramphenicol 3-O-phosphotransferase
MAGEIILITGIMAAGKSSVAQALAEQLPLSVHLRGDVFRKMIVNGRADISPENWDEAQSQLHLRYRLAAGAATTYSAAGFTVVYQDVILGQDLPQVIDLLRPFNVPVLAVVLAPQPAVVATRDRDRAKTGYGAWTAEELDAGLRDETPKIGLWLDTSHQTITETVDEILARRAEARV